METPISVSLDLQLLRQSDNPEQRSLADVHSVISELRTYVTGIEKPFEDPDSIVPRNYLRHLAESKDARSKHSMHLAMEMRHLLEELTSLTETNAPKSAKSNRSL